jgi:hypothetical protein
VTLSDLSRIVPRFDGLQHVDRIKLLEWFLHTHKKLEHFRPADIGKCYQDVHLSEPRNIPQQLADLAGKKPPELLKNGHGYRLEKRVRDHLDRKYGQRSATIEITNLLKDLPSKLPDLSERTYLDEALKCFGVEAYRASIVMTWNLAYHHLCHHILKNRLADFNAKWVVMFPAHHKNAAKAILTIDDFGDNLKESELIKIAKSASIISNDVGKILDEKLGRRNSAAHPSGIKLEQLQAEEFIDDLVKNVVLKVV